MSKSMRIVAAAAIAGLAASSWLGGRATAGGRVAAQPQSQGTAGQTGITVVGLGRVKGTPDVMRLDIGVEVHRGRVQDALDGSSAAATKVIGALRKAGVAAKDIQTTGLSIWPEYGKGDPPPITGYAVSNRVEAKIRDLAHAGDTIDAAARSGGNDVRIGGVSFALEDNEALLKQARDGAFADAKAKAQQYASLAARPLGAVVSVSETVEPTPPQAREEFAGRLLDRVAMPINPGQQEVSVSVTVVYAFA